MPPATGTEEATEETQLWGRHPALSPPHTHLPSDHRPLLRPTPTLRCPQACTWTRGRRGREEGQGGGAGLRLGGQHLPVFCPLQGDSESPRQTGMESWHYQSGAWCWPCACCPLCEAVQHERWGLHGSLSCTRSRCERRQNSEPASCLSALGSAQQTGLRTWRERTKAGAPGGGGKTSAAQLRLRSGNGAPWLHPSLGPGKFNSLSLSSYMYKSRSDATCTCTPPGGIKEEAMNL